MDNKRAVTYKLAPETRGINAPYDKKFAGMRKCCETAKDQGIENVIVSWPWVLGDTYEELVESLSRIADARLVLHIVERFGTDETPLHDVKLN